MTRSDFDTTGSLDHATSAPHGPSWDAPIERAAIAYFDFEMTGLDPARDGIIEVAIVRVEQGSIVDVLDSLVRAGSRLNTEAQAVHRITADALTSAPSFDTLTPRVQAMLADAVPVGHGTELDAQFIANATSGAITLTHRLDTLTLARRALAATSYTLPALTTKLGLPSRRWHRAMEDALAVRALFERIVGEFGDTRARDLWQVHVGQRARVVIRDDIAAALALGEETNARYEITMRSPGHAPTTMLARVERWISPHAHLFVPDRNALRVVRADRILRIRPR